MSCNTVWSCRLIQTFRSNIFCLWHRGWRWRQHFPSKHRYPPKIILDITYNPEHIQLREVLKIFILLTWTPKYTFHWCVSLVFLQILVALFRAGSTIRLSTCLMIQTDMICYENFGFPLSFPWISVSISAETYCRTVSSLETIQALLVLILLKLCAIDFNIKIN